MVYVLFSIILFLVLIKKKVLLSSLIEDRWSDKRVSLAGGMVFFIIVSFYILFHHELDESIYIIILFSTAIFILGLIDDVFTLNAKDKFLWQLLIVYCFVRVLLHGIKGIDDKWILFLLFTLGAVNSINMIDNMNGICGLTMLPILCSFTLIIPEFKQFFFILIGVLTFFLFFNLKGKIFMGDSGSHYLGLILAGFACYYSSNHFDIRAMIGIVLLFGASFLDTGYVVVRRTLNKNPFWIGDKNHLSHIIARSFDGDILYSNVFFFIASLIFNLIGVKILL